MNTVTLKSVKYNQFLLQHQVRHQGSKMRYCLIKLNLTKSSYSITSKKTDNLYVTSTRYMIKIIPWSTFWLHPVLEI